MKRALSSSSFYPRQKPKTSHTYLDFLEPDIRERIEKTAKEETEIVKILKKQQLLGYKDWEDLVSSNAVGPNTAPFFFSSLREENLWLDEDGPSIHQRIPLEGNILLRCLVRFFRLKDLDILRDPKINLLWIYDEANKMFLSTKDDNFFFLYDELLIRRDNPKWESFASKFNWKKDL